MGRLTAEFSEKGVPKASDLAGKLAVHLKEVSGGGGDGLMCM